METWRYQIWKHGEMYTWNRYVEMETWTWRHGNGDTKRKKEAQAILFNPFTICSSYNRNLSFVRLLTNKQIEAIRLQTD